MPTYSYRCTECTTAFDIQQSFTDESLTVCPQCGATLRKVFSAVGVSFSGSGFYRNDSRPAPKKSTESKKSTDAKSADAKSAETKSAPAATPAPAAAPAAKP